MRKRRIRGLRVRERELIYERMRSVEGVLAVFMRVAARLG